MISCSHWLLVNPGRHEQRNRPSPVFRQNAPFLHGLEEQASRKMSQVRPAKLVGQMHRYPAIRSWQKPVKAKYQNGIQFRGFMKSKFASILYKPFLYKLIHKMFDCWLRIPPFLQGLLEHSLISTSQLTPANPGGQLHWYPPMRSTHIPLLIHGSLTHSCMSVSHRIPWKPSWHTHLKLFTRSTQVPSCRHGLLLHSLMFSAQSVPVNPDRHRQMKLFSASSQAAPFWHGLFAHSSMSVPHVAPSKPGVHWQRKPPNKSTHVAPLWHGLLAHSLILFCQEWTNSTTDD